MNVHHVRFYAAAVFAALVSGAAPLAAQSAAEARDASSAITPIGVAPTTLDSVTALAAVAAQPTADTSSPAASAVARGPSVASARVASHALTTSRGAPPVIQKRTSNRNSVALMIVGGAALVVGAVIGDDAGTLVMLGGAGIGLYGLYLFLT